MKSRTVFISHNTDDREDAQTIALFLVSENINVWFDEWEIAAGDSILDEIDNGLQRCTHFFILWSRNSAKSNWVRKELNSALKQAIEWKKPRIVPILLDGQRLPPLLTDIRGIRYEGGTEKDRVEIIQAVSKKNHLQV